jgi:dienelactone hydrolase
MHRRLLLAVLFLIPAHLGAQDVKYSAPADVRSAFKKLLDRPKALLDAKTMREKSAGVDDWIQRDILFTAEKKSNGAIEQVPTLILAPEKSPKRLPAVIVLHGTGGNKEGQIAFMKELARRKIIAVAIDARYHGARTGVGKGAAAYNEAITKAWLAKPGEPMEHPFYYDTVWDLWRLIDYLETRKDIDTKNIGMIGFSMGGIQTYLAASVDERIKCSVPAIAVQCFRWSLENDQWQGRANTIKQAHLQAAKDLGEKEINQKVCRALWNKIVPGITEDFDCPSMLRLHAPRPMLILSGTMDKNCPYGGAKLAIASAEQAYKDAGASDRLKVMVEGVGHMVTDNQRAAALEWFEKWLK